MLYRYYSDIKIVRKAAKQSGSFAVLATEEPRGDRREVLLMQGKTGREKVPLIYGDDSTVANIVGSVLVRTQAERIVGVIGFASDDAAQSVREQYLAGELSVNLTTRPIAGVELRASESFHGVDGPAMVLTQWEPLQIILDTN